MPKAGRSKRVVVEVAELPVGVWTSDYKQMLTRVRTQPLTSLTVRQFRPAIHTGLPHA